MFFQIKTSDRDKYLSLLNESGFPINGSGWWVKYPKRAVEELYRMLSSTNARITHKQDKMIFKEEISNNFGTRFSISIEAQIFHSKCQRFFWKSQM